MIALIAAWPMRTNHSIVWSAPMPGSSHTKPLCQDAVGNCLPALTLL